MNKKIDELISGEFSNEDMDDINAELEDILSSELPELPEVPTDKLPQIVKANTSMLIATKKELRSYEEFTIIFLLSLII